jgi:predicted alpha/beta hydrolase family esterase
MPDPENPHYDSWKTTLEKELITLSNNTILIGHSLGGSTLLKFLSESAYHKTIDGLFLIAAPYWGASDWEVAEYTLRDDFSSNLPEIRRVFLYHSTDDEVVPIEHLKYYAVQFPSATIRARSIGGHLFSNGLPELIEDIKSLCDD